MLLVLGLGILLFPCIIDKSKFMIDHDSIVSVLNSSSYDRQFVVQLGVVHLGYTRGHSDNLGSSLRLRLPNHGRFF